MATCIYFWQYDVMLPTSSYPASLYFKTEKNIKILLIFESYSYEVGTNGLANHIIVQMCMLMLYYF